MMADKHPMPNILAIFTRQRAFSREISANQSAIATGFSRLSPQVAEKSATESDYFFLKKNCKPPPLFF
jgi:hypothetical protein